MLISLIIDLPCKIYIFGVFFKLSIWKPNFNMLGDVQQPLINFSYFFMIVFHLKVNICFPDTFGLVKFLLTYCNLKNSSGPIDFLKTCFKLCVLCPRASYKTKDLYLPLVDFSTSFDLTQFHFHLAVEPKYLLSWAFTQSYSKTFSGSLEVSSSYQKLGIKYPKFWKCENLVRNDF
jgi:hypothetical protein